MKKTTALSSDKDLSATLLIPFRYLYRIRLNQSKPRLASWLLIHFYPAIHWILGYGCYYILNVYSDLFTQNSNMEFTFIFVTAFILFSLSHYYLYELGYIQNDIIATKSDKMSLRLNADQINEFYKRQRLIYFSHFAPHIICLIALSLSPLFKSYFLKPYIIAISLSFLCFFCFILYNNTQYKYRIFIYPILQVMKYTPSIFLLLAIKPLTGLTFISITLLMLICIYPLEISIERFSMPAKRYGLIKKIIPDENSKKLFRIIYYLILLAICSICFIPMLSDTNHSTLFFNGSISAVILYLLPVIFFLLYRILIYLTQQKK